MADFSEDRLAVARELGATHTVDPRHHSPYELWNELATGGVAEPIFSIDGESEPAPAPRCFVYECVGMPGVLDGIVRDSPMRTHIFTAGGAPEGDHISSAIAKRKGTVIHFGGGPQREDWYGTLDAVLAGELDPSPVIGMTVDLDGVPAALDLARSGKGPARIMIHPHGPSVSTEPESLTVGMVGIGNMGMPIARRIRAAGYEVHAFARRPEVIERGALVRGGSGGHAVRGGDDERCRHRQCFQ